MFLKKSLYDTIFIRRRGVVLCSVRRRLITSSSAADMGEMDRFESLAGEWWDESGPMKAFHSMNRVRVPWIRDTLLRSKNKEGGVLPLEGFSVLDVGCGRDF